MNEKYFFLMKKKTKSFQSIFFNKFYLFIYFFANAYSIFLKPLTGLITEREFDKLDLCP